VYQDNCSSAPGNFVHHRGKVSARIFNNQYPHFTDGKLRLRS
jgi:hypothetical protein